MDTLIPWLFRYGHVLAACIWVGGYVILALVIIPRLAAGADERLAWLAAAIVRALTYAGTATIIFGILLITRTRGFASLIGGEWGALVIASSVAAIVLMGLGDGAMRPALARLAATGDAGPARRLALLGLALTVLTIGLMTRAVYAGS
jgi:putative copper export protein